MTSDEIKAEAERRFRLWLPTGDYEIDREDYSEFDAAWQNEDTERDRALFVLGAEWQAEQRAERIHELEAELKRREGLVASLHQDVMNVGRERAEMALDAEEHFDELRKANARANAAEARLDKVREMCAERVSGYPDNPYNFVREFSMKVLAILDGRFPSFPMRETAELEAPSRAEKTLRDDPLS